MRPACRGVSKAVIICCPLTCRSVQKVNGCVGVRAMATSIEVYGQVAERLKEISGLEGVSGLVQWDEMVMMPPGAAEARSHQKAVLAGVIHEKATAPALGELLEKVQPEDLDPYQAAVVRDARKAYGRATAISKELAQRRARLESEGYQVIITVPGGITQEYVTSWKPQAWVQARKESDWSLFAPKLQEWVALSREVAACIDADAPIYDVLLDEYEKGMTAARLDDIFGQVKQGLLPLLGAIRDAAGNAPDASMLQGSFDPDAQAKLCEQLAKAIGFDVEKGRLDVSVHPFTGGSHPTDVRMTTRFQQKDLTEGFQAAIHETGHALYEQGRNLDYDGLPVNTAMSMGIHESQSLLWERMVALSPAFAKYLLPQLLSSFPELPADLTPEKLYAALNVVKEPSLIRVESDEVTYPMHIVIRYELERALLEGSVTVDELPQLWNEKMQTYLGCTPADDAQGILQDVHWSAGAFGYFPTYSLGAMYACQIFACAKEQLPGLEDNITAGDFAPLKAWLNTNIHKLGSFHTSGDALMEAVTGKAVDPEIFLDYLSTKYSALYKLPA